MPAIPQGPHPFSKVDDRFKSWLKERNELRFVTHFHALGWEWLVNPSPDGTDLTWEDYERFNKLKKEFLAQRPDMQKVIAAKRQREAATRAKDIPDSEIKKRITPRRFVKKGLAG